MNLNHLHRSILAALALALSSTLWSFGEGKPEGAEFHPEQTQEQVREQQKYQGVIGEVGEVPADTDEPVVDDPEVETSAADVVAQAPEDRAAANNLRKASRQRPGHDSFWWIWVGLGGTFAAGAIGVRRWVRATVPDLPRSPKVKW